MSVLRLIIEYEGTNFSGWQSQPQEGVRTVQGELERALATVLRKPVRLQGAGRTDAGVHALGQVASFEWDNPVDPERLARSLTGIAGPEVAVLEIASAPTGFNARFDATGKHYRYRVLARRAPSPIARRRTWFVPRRLNIEAMQKAAEKLAGHHDFAGFRAADDERKTTDRELTEVAVQEEGGGFVTLEVKGTAFLKNMVRILAGTLVDIGKGRRTPEIIDEIFATGDRALAGPTAPAHGLTLVEVFYPPGWIRKR